MHIRLFVAILRGRFEQSYKLFFIVRKQCKPRHERAFVLFFLARHRYAVIQLHELLASFRLFRPLDDLPVIHPRQALLPARFHDAFTFFFRRTRRQSRRDARQHIYRRLLFLRIRIPCHLRLFLQNVLRDFVRIGDRRKQGVRVVFDRRFPASDIRAAVSHRVLVHVDTEILFHEHRRNLRAQFFHRVFFRTHVRIQRSVEPRFVTRRMPHFVQRRRIKLLHVVEILAGGKMDFIARLAVIRLRTAVYDLRFVPAPIGEHPFRAIRLPAFVQYRNFPRRNTIYEVGVEYRIIPPDGIYVFVHICPPFVRAHAIQHISVKLFVRFPVPQVKKLHRHARIFAEAPALGVRPERPVTRFHLIECQPAIVAVAAPRSHEKEIQIIYTSVFLARDCVFRRPAHAPARLPQ